MYSLTEHKFSVLLTGLLLITGLGGIPTAFASSEDPGMTTTEVESPDSAVGANHGGDSHNLKVHGNMRWDLDASGAVKDETGDLGDSTEYDGIGTDYFDTVRFEPAYDEDSRIDGNVDNILTLLKAQYHPTFWQDNTRAVEPGTSTALFDISNTGELDYNYLFDEDVDSGIDDDNQDDPIDLLGVDDNVPDFASRNEKTTENDDLYFPALVQNYTFVGYGSSDTQADFQEDDRITIPVSGNGSQPGLSSDSAGVSDSAVFVNRVDSGSDNIVRLETEELELEVGDTLRFWDFEATLQDISGEENPSAKWRINWLGDYNNPQRIGSTVTIGQDEVIRADKGSTSTHDTSNCGGKPTTATQKPWYLCATTVNGQSDIVFANAGRTLSPVHDDGGEEAGTILVNGALYQVTNLEFGSDLASFSLQQVTPVGEDFEFARLDATLQGVAQGDSVPVLPPFSEDHQAVQDYDLEADRNTYGFLDEADQNDNGIQADDIDLDESNDDIDDRLEDRSALEYSWQVRARETGLLANKEDPNTRNEAWEMEFQNVFPNHYLELDLPSDTTQLVESGLYEAVTGFKNFTWESGQDNAVHFSDGLRLFSEDLADDNGDKLLLNPALQTDTDSRANGSTSNVLVSPEFSYDTFEVFDDRDGDNKVDLNVLADEESDDQSGVDDDNTRHTVDDTGDNLFAIEGDQNNDDDEGDIYAPAIQQKYTYRWLKKGSQDPRPAGVDTSADFAAADSDSKIRLAVATDGHDGEGLDSADVGEDSAPEETLVEALFTDDSADGTVTSTDLLRLESERVTIDRGERGQFFDVEIRVDSTDTESYDDGRARFSFYHVDESGSTNDEIGTGLSGIQEGKFIGITYNYDTGDTSIQESPKQADTLDDGSGTTKYDWYAHVETISSGSVTLSMGRLMPVGEDIFVDGQKYQISNVDQPHGDTIDSFTLQTVTPIADDDVELVQPSVDVNAISSGDTLPVIDPFDQEHQVADTIGVDLEETQYGAFNEDLSSDGDATEVDTSDRLLDAPALDITVQENEALERQSFIWSDSQTDSQRVNGIFNGSEAGKISEGHPDGGFPDASNDNTPTSSNHQGTFFSSAAAAGFTESPVDNGNRGFKQYVTLDVASGHGDFLLETPRFAQNDNNAVPGANVANWTSAGSCSGGIQSPPCIEEQTSPKGWYMFSSGDVTDLFLGTGEVPEGQEEDLEDQAEGGLSNFVADSISCGTSTLQRGQSVGCDITVQNTGSRSGTKSVDLVATSPGGSTSTASSGDVSIDAGASKTVSRTWSTTSTTELGDWSLKGVTPDDETSTTTIAVEQAAGEGTADIVVNSVSVSPGTVTVGDAVTVSGQAENVGDGDGSKSFDVVLDGETIATVTVSVNAGETQNFATQITPTESGDFTVEVGGQSAQLTVNPKDSDGDGIPDPQDSCPNQSADTSDGCPEGADGGDGDGEDGGDEGPVPGFSVYALITALVSAAIVARRRNRT